MCGVVSIVYRKDNRSLGKEGAALLKKLEYRGYDSTGAAFFKENGTIYLRKRVGSPTKVVQELEIEKYSGVKFIGQVRWATYGSVTDENAQPHEMSCRVHLVGAHNGNISNTDTLKEYLLEHRHNVLSDNDGEMLVHVVEHYYAQLLQEFSPETLDEQIKLFIKAIRKMNRKVEGSYAACISAPDIPGVFAIKAGSSLYAGKGQDQAGDFVVASSDLTSVLSKTRFLIPLAEGEAVYFTHDDYLVFSLSQEVQSRPALNRSRLNIADITLQSKYSFFMHQEIYTASANLKNLLQYYFPAEREGTYFSLFEKHEETCRRIAFELLKLYSIFDWEQLRQALEALFTRPDFEAVFQDVLGHVGPGTLTQKFNRFTSDEAQLLRELQALGDHYREKLLLLDLIIIWKKKRKIIHFRKELVQLLKGCASNGGRVFVVGAGTSYHAALVAANFFNNIGNLSVIPLNPGMFRSMFLKGLQGGDIMIGVTQSGETKDLLDIFNDIRERYENQIRCISVVNNENSTIPQEKSDFFLPILCGPEIAVAATKSFISQIALFYLLAASSTLDEKTVRSKIREIQYVIDLTLTNCEDDVSEVALKLFLKPSMHILGTSLLGLAKEGALKVREVVLNHTEGYDCAEFKHGPNTILGRNTLYSLWDMESMLQDMLDFFKELISDPGCQTGNYPDEVNNCLDLLKAIQFKNYVDGFDGNSSGSDQERHVLGKCYQLFRKHIHLEHYFSNYPLIFVCPPDARDKRITISQIHTHKIRGADVVLIALDDEDLEKAVLGKPAAMDHYYAKYIKVPKIIDPDMFVFGATVVLQLLALKMSVAKMRYLNRNHVEKHGVHPDVPKNVSKSITVD
ncbi:SIS domain-containing protein [candidate division CSSED10-310 bacterium]|uniref:Glutamine--fructose-6-phosphate aminotransferase [isomerizing] n=1 Tax=candidate division CSSED10-310 bacterium TaxID=2855610 RepID=A0ABV6Z5S6_UNCC1